MKPLRGFVAALSTSMVVVVAGINPTAAGAAPSMAVHQDVYATTTLAKMGMTMSAPKGSFDGNVDLATGDLVGSMSIPPSQTTLSIFGILPTATIGFAMEPTAPVRGHVDFATLQSTTTASFNIHITRMSLHNVQDVNVVGDQCRTVTPITITMSGAAALTTASTFSGSFTIPEFANCQALTPLINAIIPGPDNTFTATFGPAGTPPPPAPAASGPLTPAVRNAGVNLQVGDQNVQLPPLNIAAPLPIPAPAPGGGLLDWLLKAG